MNKKQNSKNNKKKPQKNQIIKPVKTTIGLLVFLHKNSKNLGLGATNDGSTFEVGGFCVKATLCHKDAIEG